MAETKNVAQDLVQRDMTLLYHLRFWSLTLLRVFLGILFTYHGFLRLFVPGNLAGSAVYFAKAAIPFAAASSFLFGIVELIGGLLILIGLFTRWSAFVLMLEMMLIFFWVHLKNGFLLSGNGYEFVLVLIAALLFVLVNGAGHLSLGKMIGKNNS